MTLSDPSPNAAPPQDWLASLCDISAAMGALVLLSIALMTATSVIGRAFFMHPILGDVELVQLGGAVVVAAFLPYTQYCRANVIVDFFTTGTSARARARMDAAGIVIYTAVMALVCWRVAVGCVDIHAAGERSMLMDLPLWLPYLLMLPGLGLCVLIGVVQLTRMAAGRAGVHV